MSDHDELPRITPEAESSLENALYTWKGDERAAMIVAYNIGRRHENARWREHIESTLADIIGVPI